LNRVSAVGAHASAFHPSPLKDGLQHNQEPDDNEDNSVAAVGPQDPHDSRKQQDENKTHNGEDSWSEHVEPQSFVSEPLPDFSDPR
jgi:hypothetical protein